MHVTDRSKTVVMLIDWDNLQICHSRDAPGTELDLQALIALAQSYGTLVSARAYAEWNLLSERLAVYKAGIEPVFAPVMRPEGSPREGKSLADTVMVADGVDLLWTVAPDVFVLATSDKDMIPLARIAKQRGAAVVVLGSDLTAIPLVEMMWADGRADRVESELVARFLRDHVDRLNRLAGAEVLSHADARRFLARFAAERPHPELLELLSALVPGLSLASSDAATNRDRRQAILDFCLQIGAACTPLSSPEARTHFERAERECFWHIVETLDLDLDGDAGTARA